MKSIIVAGIVAALVAASTATAALVVTSKNIKNGTIQTVDISKKARAALRGQRGLRGLTGAPGLQGVPGPVGAQGPPGARGPGLTGMEYVTNQVTGTDVVIARVQCPEGKFVIAGGGSSDVGVLFASEPIPPQGWAVGAEGFGPVGVFVQALCASASGLAATKATATESLRAAEASRAR